MNFEDWDSDISYDKGARAFVGRACAPELSSRKSEDGKSIKWVECDSHLSGLLHPRQVDAFEWVGR